MLIAYVGGIPTTWFITHWEKSEVVPAHWEVGPDWPMKLRAEWIQTAEMMAKFQSLRLEWNRDRRELSSELKREGCEVCRNYLQRGSNRFKCGACRKVLYCSLACQKIEWKRGHKAACGQLKDTPKYTPKIGDDFRQFGMHLTGDLAAAWDSVMDVTAPSAPYKTHLLYLLLSPRFQFTQEDPDPSTLFDIQEMGLAPVHAFLRTFSSRLRLNPQSNSILVGMERIRTQDPGSGDGGKHVMVVISDLIYTYAFPVFVFTPPVRHEGMNWARKIMIGDGDWKKQLEERSKISNVELAPGVTPEMSKREYARWKDGYI